MHFTYLSHDIDWFSTTVNDRPAITQSTNAGKLCAINVSSCREIITVRKCQCSLSLKAAIQPVTKQSFPLLSQTLQEKLRITTLLCNCCVSMLHLLGVLQRGVPVVWWFQALHQAGVKMSVAFDEPPCHGKLLFQHFIECKYSWIEGAESWGRDMGHSHNNKRISTRA